MLRHARLLVIVSGTLLAVPAVADAQTLQTWTVSSRYVDVSKVMFNSPPRGVPARPPGLRVDVLLPDGYDGVKRFPVLYLLHGHGDSYDSWINANNGDLLHVAPSFPGIVVMPEAATGWYTNWWDAGARGSDGRAWESYLLDEVIPMAESRLRIAPGRANHAIAGLSMGGEGAMFFAAALPGYFGSAASFSGVLSLQRPEWPTAFDTQGQNHLDVYGDPSAQQFYWSGHDPTAMAANLAHTRLFVRVGDGTPVPYYDGEATNYFGALAESELRMHAQDFVAAARAVGADVTFEPTTGVHDWPYWRLSMQSALKWGFFRAVEEHALSWTYKTVAQRGRVWDIGYRFDSPPDVLETLTRSGDTLTGAGTGTASISPDGRAPLRVSFPFTVNLGPLLAAATPAGGGACGSGRASLFAIHQGAGRVIQVDVYIGDRLVRRVRARRITRLLVKLPRASAFTLRIVDTTATANQVITRRRYRGCRKGPAHTTVRHLRGVLRPS